MSQELVIVAAKRTALGGFLGNLSQYSAVELAIHSHLSCLQQAKLSPSQIDEVIMGCVLSAGLGQAPARQTALGAGLNTHTISSTVNKVCGSGLLAVQLACDSIMQGRSKMVMAGGMESMSKAPYLLPKARAGYRLGHGQCLDHMWLDGLQDAYDPEKKLMGCFGELAAKTFDFSRQAQDDFARNSMQKALAASFKDEIAIIDEISQDELPNPAKLEKLTRLKPVFDPSGTITAGNSSSIADGAASLILTSIEHAKQLDIPVLAKICGFSCYAQEPAWFTTAPAHSIEKLLKNIGWRVEEVDLWEINEAFAVVAMAAIKHLKLDENKVNVHGGACALGHPIGASGARILVSLIYALAQRGLKKGIASICIGGGEALSVAIEL